MIQHKNFYYNTSVNYKTIYSCDVSGCDDEGICRCSEIENAEVDYVDVFAIAISIYEDMFDSKTKTGHRDDQLNILLNGYSKELNLYTIDRILRKWKIWEKSKWQIDIVNGYYGQEIEGVEIKLDIADEIQSDIETALSIENMKDRIEWLLKLEYGSILKSLVDVEWSIERVDYSKLIFGSKTNEKAALKEILKLDGHRWGYFYSKSRWGYKPYAIMGVVLKEDIGFRVIDGYHRLLSCDKHGEKLVLVAKK